MHIVDIIFLCAAAVVTIIGIKRGLITEAFRLAAVAAGVVCAMLFHRAAASLLGFIAVPDSVRVSLGFAAVFAVVMGAVMAAGWAVRKVVHLTVLGWVDRVCGGCLGFAKCALVAWAISLIAAALPVPRIHASLSRSAVYTACIKLPVKLRMPAPRDIGRQLDNIIDTQAVGDIPGRLRELREKVDSAKGAIR